MRKVLKKNKQQALISVEAINEAADNLRSVVKTTPLELNEGLYKKYQCNVFLKREDLQVVRSFKIRGAYHKMASLSSEQLANGVVCASAGNHAQGVALACKLLQCNGKIFMPSTTPNQKISKVRHFGENFVEIELVGDHFDECNDLARVYSKKNSLSFIHPFNDNTIMAGQGTVGKEIFEQSKSPIDFVVVSLGGGGLCSGVGSYFNAVSPLSKIIAVEAAGAPAFHESIKAGRKVLLDDIDGFADGIAVRAVGDITFNICSRIIDKTVLVPEGKICSTILELYNDDAIVVEPAGAISVSALDYMKDEIKGKNIVCIVSGGNNDIRRTEDIRERALLYEGKKQYYMVNFPQRAGALREFLNYMGPQDDITYFQYTKKNNRESGPAVVGIEFDSSDSQTEFIKVLDNGGMSYRQLNKDQMLFDMLV